MSSRDLRPRHGKRVIPAHFRRQKLQTNLVAFEQPAPEIDAKASLVPVVRIFDPAVRDGVQDIDISDWASRPQIAWALADFLSRKARTTSAGTRRGLPRKLRPFLGYLDAEWPHAIGLRDLTNEVLSGYVTWLAKGRSLSRTGSSKPWTDLTKRMRYKAVIAFLHHCRRKKTIASHLSPTLRIVGTHPWSGADRRVQPRRALTQPELRSVVDRCLVEIDATIRRLKDGAEVRSDETLAIPKPFEPSVVPYKNIRVRLRTLIKRHGDRIPPGPVLKAKDPGLFRSMVPNYGSFADTATYLHFTPRSLVPFVLLLAIQTLHNPDGLLRLRWSDIEASNDVLGNERWTVIARKGRANQPQARSFSAKVKANGHAVVLLKLLREFSEPARFLAPERLRDRVFLFMQINEDRFASYEHVDCASGAKTWSLALARFLQENDLTPFTLANLRPTGGEILDVMTLGDLKRVQRMLGHQSAVTTDEHYLSENARRRGREDLAAGISLIERFAATGGGKDSRRDGSEDLGAATPGFVCAQPLQSPIPFQSKGTLCTAYGECPTCPLASVNSEDPRAYRRLLQLKDALVAARDRAHPRRWIAVLQPRLVAVEEVWLAGFSNATRAASKNLVEPLPLPSIE